MTNGRRAIRRAEARAAELRASGEHDAMAGWQRGQLVRAVNNLVKLRMRPDRSWRRPGSDWAGPRPRRQPAGQPARRRCPPDRQGRLGKPVEFGYKAQVIDNDDGIILDHNVEVGNPADAPQLVPGDRADHSRAPDTRHGPSPPTAATVRHGRERPARTRRTQRRDPPQRQTFRPASRGTPERVPAKIKWRTGTEGRISPLKRGYGWDRTASTGIERQPEPGAGHGVFTHNLVKISTLAA